MATGSSEKILDGMIEVSAETIRVIDGLNLPRSVVDQVTRSVTSIGANYAEAQDASSKKDFINKIFIAKKEANETIYWMKLIKKLSEPSLEIDDLQQKVQGYLMMLQKIVTTSRAKN